MDAVADPILGRLVPNGQLGWYEGQVSWCGVSANIALSAETSEELAACREAAVRLLAQAAVIHPMVLEALVADLLPLKNGEWFDPEEDAAPYTRDTFLAPLTIEGLTVYPNGDAELFFLDGGLFFGHTLIAVLDSAGAVTEVSLAG